MMGTTINDVSPNYYVGELSSTERMLRCDLIAIYLLFTKDSTLLLMVGICPMFY